jgi:N-acyl-D-amino-acid deacylase
MYDVLFRNARVYDGTGAPWFEADVAVKDGFIVRVGKSHSQSAITIDARGKCLSPGFIDSHSHSDEVLLSTPTADSKIMQGVTLEVIGQCGSSAAPRGLNDTSDEEKSSPSWTDMASYLDLLERQGVSVNVAAIVGHGNIRRQVMGTENRPPNEDELSSMKNLLTEALEQGAFGMSTGLIYVPGTYSNTEEIVALAKLVAAHDGIYVTHMRNEGPYLIQALNEALTIGKEAGLPVQISHFKVMGKDNWGKVKETIKMVEEARENGLDITADQYPYIASSTGLDSSVPSEFWAQGRESALKSLKDPSHRKEMIECLSKRENWNNLVIASLDNPEDQQYIGKSVEEIGLLRGTSPAEACIGLLERNNGVVQIVNFAMCEEDVEKVMKCPWVMAGSDSSAQKVETAVGQPHPRAYGTFARILGLYSREKKVLRLEEAIRKMTSLPAMRLGLQDRGVLREGMRADLTLFDYDTVIDNATFTEPHQYASGIEWVLVNGIPVVKDGKHTGARPGRVLRRSR